MDLKAYFEEKQGRGMLATADAHGRVDLALYAKPHVMEDGTIAFIMADRLTHHNLTSNPSAAYMYIEQGPGHNGVRLFLRKIKEEENSELLKSLRRRGREHGKGQDEKNSFLVFFEIEKVLPLIGDGSPG